MKCAALSADSIRKAAMWKAVICAKDVIWVTLGRPPVHHVWRTGNATCRICELRINAEISRQAQRSPASITHRYGIPASIGQLNVGNCIVTGCCPQDVCLIEHPLKMQRPNTGRGDVERR